MGLGPRPASLTSLAGTITDAQHGAKTGPANAHEMADVSGTVTAAQHGDLTGAGAGGRDAHHGRTEAKETPGSAASESVTWSAAFAVAPIVNVSVNNAAAAGSIGYVTARSTTGATVESRLHDNTALLGLKYVIAQAAT